MALSEWTNGIQDSNLPVQSFQKQVYFSKFQRMAPKESLGPQPVKKKTATSVHSESYAKIRTYHPFPMYVSIVKETQPHTNFKETVEIVETLQACMQAAISLKASGIAHHGRFRQALPRRIIVACKA
jgi:hypothetical protein